MKELLAAGILAGFFFWVIVSGIMVIRIKDNDNKWNNAALIGNWLAQPLKLNTMFAPTVTQRFKLINTIFRQGNLPDFCAFYHIDF